MEMHIGFQTQSKKLYSKLQWAAFTCDSFLQIISTTLDDMPKPSRIAKASIPFQKKGKINASRDTCTSTMWCFCPPQNAPNRTDTHITFSVSTGFRHTHGGPKQPHCSKGKWNKPQVENLQKKIIYPTPRVFQKYFKNGSWKNHRKLKWFLSPFNLEKFQFVYCQKMMVAKEHHTKTITIQHHSKWKMCHAPTNCPIDPRITPSLRILVARCKCYSIHHWSGGRSNERKHPQSQAAKHQAPGIMSWYSEKNKNTIGYSLLFQPPSWNGNEYIYI